MASLRPERLSGRQLDKIWGSTHLEPWFQNSHRNIGEVWFAQDNSLLLIKFLFTTENLSVQVHPNDEQARADGGVRGKTEMWHILRAEPHAQIALGLNQPADLPEIREACLDGSIMKMLRWIPARAGDTWFVPAGAIHAVGAGIALCEVQQHSDITYRLYDYGRDRDLHLDQGLTVLDPAFRAATISKIEVDCPYFHVEAISLSGSSRDFRLHASSPASYLVATRGEGLIAGLPFRMGEVWLLPDAQSIVELSGDAQLLHVIG